MSESPQRRSKVPPETKIPTGYRSSRRASKSLKSAKRAERNDRMFSAWDRFIATLRNIGYVLAMGLGVVLAAAIVLLIVANAINGIARWRAEHRSTSAAQSAASTQSSQENLLVIGVQNGTAVGFLAIRVDAKGRQVFGVAIPEGAFIEVPGQGYERVGESFSAGPNTSLSAVSNYLLVPFRQYVTVSSTVYQNVLKTQTVTTLASSILATNLTAEQRAALGNTLAGIGVKNTALVPLPVKPIKLGTQTYFEPQRSEVADLLKAWWGVDASATSDVTRVLIYNGAGRPGIAGQAATQLIRAGFRVIDTKNADTFNYKTTLVIVQRGPVEKGAEVVKALGVGTVSEKRTDQDVSDIVVLIGRDFVPAPQ
jgi:hypothetical protein